MILRTLFLCTLLLLGGCADRASGKWVYRAVEECEKNGGLEKVYVSMYSKIAYCKNGAQFEKLKRH